jgi:hypothetical protein
MRPASSMAASSSIHPPALRFVDASTRRPPGAADAQLYRAKNAGRNRLCASAAPSAPDQDAGQEGVFAVT